MAHEQNALIVSLTETHLTDDIKEAEVHFSNYVHFRTDRSERKKGGVITFVKETLASNTEVLLSESNSFIEVQMIHVRSLDLVYVNIYRPPACPRNKFGDQLMKIRDVINNLPPPMPTIILTGDVNFPLINWDSETVYGGTADMRAQAEEFLELAKELCLIQRINTPTRDENILDIVMINNDDFIHNYTVDKTILSDHNIITIETNLTSTKQTDIRVSKLSEKLDFNKLNYFSESVHWENLKQDLSEVDWVHRMDNCDPVAQYETIITTCLDLSRKHVPLRNKRSKLNIPRDRKILMRKRNNLRKKLQHTTSVRTRAQIENKINIIEDDLKKSIEMENDRNEAQAVACIKTNPKYFYKYAANKSKVKSGVGPLRVQNDRIITEPEEISEALSQHYQSVFSNPVRDKIIQTPIEFFHQGSEPQLILTHIELTTERIEEAIKELSINSAPGPDQFPAIFLKKCATELAIPLLFFFFFIKTA